MSRPLRLHVPGLLHHVFSRGNNKACIFEDDDDYKFFLELLSRTTGRFRVECVAYCLLWNHYHLLLIPHEFTISRLMQQLNSRYCQRFNRRHHRVGHVLQGRFGSPIIGDGAYARSVLRYVALNPVAAGLVKTPDDWRWSSYRATLGLEPAPVFLSLEPAWSAFGTTEANLGRSRFAEFVRAGCEGALTNSLLHGSERLAIDVAPQLEPHQGNVDFVYAHRFAARPPLSALLAGCHDRASAEDAAHAAYSHHGYSLLELGRALCRHPSVISRWIKCAAERQPPPPGDSGGV
jgi:putative transposase